MNNTILFYSEKITPRLRYTIATIVGNLSGLSFIFTQDKTAFLSADLPKINYSDVQISGKELRISPHRLLFDNSIFPYVIDTEKDFFINQNNSKCKYTINAELNQLINLENNLAFNSLINTPFNFDLFARIFYLVSRYEEYNCPPSVFDTYQRFGSTSSVASKLDFLQQPLVNQYVIALSKHLKILFPNLKTQLPTYKFQPTFDIDKAWLYKNKGILRNTGGLLKDILKAILNGQLNSIKNRANILRGIKNDPYYTFEAIKNMHQSYGIKPVVFWLLGDLAKYDKSIDWQVPEFQALIQSFAKDFTVGIHPSYRSNQSVSILKMEMERLVNILNIKQPSYLKKGENAQNTEGGLFPFPSRQHFLKLRFPETYRRLLAVGIHEDWTMGYADQTGFRASIATPFPWFDVEKNEETPLIIHPFQAMDVTLNNYLKLTPEAALERLKTLIDTTKSVGGTFTTLWHNDNLAEMDNWKGWRAVYEKLLLAATYP